MAGLDGCDRSLRRCSDPTGWCEIGDGRGNELLVLPTGGKVSEVHSRKGASERIYRNSGSFCSATYFFLAKQ